MNYEKAYKEALERAKGEWVKNLDNAYKNYRERLEIIFPELKESEDERIRKAIIGTLPKYGYLPQTTIKVEDALAWLEKQGEQMSTNDTDEEIVKTVKDTSVLDMVEPKFKVGDWVVQGCNILKIRCVGAEYYCFETVGGYTDDMLVSELDSLYHLWTIQDAKDGDVLACGDKVTDCPFIFHNLTEELNPRSYCGVAKCQHFQYNDENCGFWCHSDEVRPATKEQRELLFKKMEEAGYEWNDEKKELKKVWQKLTELAKGEDYGIDGLYAAVDILQKTLGEVDGYQTDDGILEHECAISAVKKLYEQNPTWSEEDDYNLQCMIAKVTSDIQKGNVGRNNELIDWLKSIKEKVQPKQEWSDEDEFRLNRIVENIELLNDANGNILFKDIEWLKSLKNRLSKVKNC